MSEIGNGLDRAAIDNIWRHWWAGHMRAVGGTSRLPLLPLPELRSPPVEPVVQTTRRRPLTPIAREIGDLADEFLEILLQGAFYDGMSGQVDQIMSAGIDYADWNLNRANRRAITRSLRQSLRREAQRDARTANSQLRESDFYLVASPLLSQLAPGGRYATQHPPANFYDAEIDFACVGEDENGIYASRVATMTDADAERHRAELRALAAGFVGERGDYLNDWLAAVGDERPLFFFADGWFPKDATSRAFAYKCARIDDRWAQVDYTGDGAALGWDENSEPLYQRRIMEVFVARAEHRDYWHVALSRPDKESPRLVIPTNPAGCLDLFRGRDLSPGEKRRSALRHWVNEHFRERSADPGAVDYVREHLRGVRLFTWNGLACELMVSESDMEKNEFFKTKTAGWRAMRAHNRVRLRVKSRPRSPKGGAPTPLNIQLGGSACGPGSRMSLS